MSNDTTFRTLHDIGLAAWFGGSLFGVTALNPAAEEAPDQRTTDVITSIGWAKWSPINTVALGVHAVGGIGLIATNKGRLAAQKGAPSTAGAKLLLTGAALAATGYARLLGKKIENAAVHRNPAVPSSATSHADPATTRSGEVGGAADAVAEADKRVGQALGDAADRLPVDIRQAKQQLTWVQFAIPALTGAALVLAARESENQRPGGQADGIARRAGFVLGLDV